MMDKMSRAKISIPFKWVAAAAHAILIIPVLIFFTGWLKWYFGLLFSAVLLFGAVWMIRKEYWDNTDRLELPLVHTVPVMAIFGLWVLFSGSCGVGVSNYDTPWRTAYLRDLTTFDWPVYYPQSDAGLCYYFIFWMVPSLFGKVFGLSGAFVVQWIWMVLMVTVSFLLILYLFKDYRAKVLWLVCSFMVLWSGINILGTVFTDIMGWNPYGGIPMRALEDYCAGFANGESFNFLYRCNDEYLKQIYNQLPIIVCVPLYLQNRKIRNFAFWGLLLFPFSPWGTIGLGILMVIDAARFMVKDPFKLLIREVFSIQNLSAVFSVFIVFGLFFTANSRTDTGQGGGFGIITLSKFDFPRIAGLIAFWLCEFGIYFAFLWKKYRKDFNFRVLLPVLMLIPFFWVGNIWGRDFCMNVSLPALYILMVYMIGYVKDEVMGQALDGKKFALVLCLAAAATTPVFDWAAKTKVMVSQKSFVVQDDSFYTYSDKNPDELINQLVINPDKNLFYMYLARQYKDG